MKTKVLVLGGTGFIGRNVITSLLGQGNFEIHATHFSKKPWSFDGIQWIKSDLTNEIQVKDLFSFKRFDLIIQSAATTSGISDTYNSPDFHVTNNVIMNSLILKYLNLYQAAHFIFFSCTNMLVSSVFPQNEESFDPKVGPIKEYFGVGWTKVYIEKLIEFYSKFNSNKFTVIRHSNIYGPWDRFELHNSHVCAATITKVLDAEKEIIVWGDGSESRDLLYISDLVDLVLLLWEKQSEKYLLINAGGEKLISVKELTNKILSICEKKLDITYEQFIELCILFGCDYCPTVTDAKPNELFEAYIKHKSIEKTLEELKIGRAHV